MKNIDAQTLVELRENKDNLTVVNVLPEENFRQRHIPQSANIPVTESEFADKVADKIGGRDQPVVVYCASEQCDASQKAAKQLDQAGFAEVYDFTGGMDAWQEAGEPVQAGVKPGCC